MFGKTYPQITQIEPPIRSSVQSRSGTPALLHSYCSKLVGVHAVRICSSIRVICGLILGPLVGCATPLTNKIEVGQDPFVIGVGEGADRQTDLYAAPASGGSFVRLTFNRPAEHSPRLAPDGLRVAYLRQDPAGWSLVVLDLSDNGERSVALPRDLGSEPRLGWNEAADTVAVLGTMAFLAPAAGSLGLLPVAPGGLARADSLTREWVGPSREGALGRCEPSGEVCIRVGPALTPLGPGVSGAIRWGADSVGYFQGGNFEIRPLRGGRARRPLWEAIPENLRELTYFAGGSPQVTTRSGVSGRR